MAANNAKENNVQPLFRIENNVFKGRKVSHENKYSNVGELLLECLRSDPSFVCQVDAITEIEDTFADVGERVVKCALWMQNFGILEGDVVAICTHNHRDSMIPMIAAFLLGAIATPWSSEVNVQLARYFATLTQPKIIFANEKSAGDILEAIKLDQSDTIVTTFGEYPGTRSFTDALTNHDECDVKNFRCKELCDLDQTALIYFSSGTTGQPKGTQISHKSMLLELLELNEGIPLKEVALWYSSLAWISGTIFSLKSIHARSKKIISPNFDEKDTCRVIEKYKVAFMMLSTSMANRLIRFNRLKDYDLSSLETFVIGGAPLKPESQDLLRKLLPHASILQVYGMTELGGVVTSQLPDSTCGSCGIVNHNCELKVVDPETGRTLEINQSGELCVKTPKVMTGYYRDPEATNEIIDKDGWLHTGDLAFIDEKGELFVIDRLKELIKYRGEHVLPNEVEGVLLSHPAVLEAAVVGVPHPTDDEHPIAFVSKIPNREVSAEELMKMVESVLTDSCKLRGGVEFLPRLPHTHSGKIARKELKTMARKLAAGEIVAGCTSN